MVYVQVSEQQEHAFGALPHEAHAELTDAGAGVQDHDVAPGGRSSMHDVLPAVAVVSSPR